MRTSKLINLLAQSVLLFALISAAKGEIIYVDATIKNANFLSLTNSNVQYPHIQAAIDAVVDGDTIILATGIFRGEGNRDIDFKGKAITVRSTDPNDPNIVAATIIDCNGSETEPHQGFYFHNGEDANSILEGVTITNGFQSNGAGICCIASSPIIRKNIIMNNKIEFDGTGGAGIACWDGASPSIINNIIKQNICYPGGGGGGILCCRAGPLIISNNTISSNIPSGIDIDDCSPVISNCKIIGNAGGIITSKVNVETSPTIRNCTITGNSAPDGGGMYNYYTSPIIIDCNFTDNCATGFEEDGGGYGGGMFNDHSSPTLINCTFNSNSAIRYGGAMHNQSSNPMLTNCTFSGNSATYEGGGMRNVFSSPTITKCRFYANTAGAGGAISSYYVSGPTMTNCIFSQNNAGYGGGAVLNDQVSSTVTNCLFSKNSAGGGGTINNIMSSVYMTNCTFSENSASYGSSIYGNIECQIELANCILWNNQDAHPTYIYLTDDHGLSMVSISYCDIKGGKEAVFIRTGYALYWGPGNIDSNPLFADPNNGDYHLKSQAGRWDANEGRWTIDEVTSLCIDAGDAESPIGLEPFPNGGIINMGAYGGTAEASKSYFGKPPCETIVVGDINGDCIVDFKDFAIMAFHWLEEH